MDCFLQLRVYGKYLNEHRTNVQQQEITSKKQKSTFQNISFINYEKIYF